MTTKVIYTQQNYTDHKGLVEVINWLLMLHGKPKKWGDRGWFIWESALAIVNEQPMPAVIKEGSTNRDWRAAADRINTVRMILERAKS